MSRVFLITFKVAFWGVFLVIFGWKCMLAALAGVAFIWYISAADGESRTASTELPPAPRRPRWSARGWVASSSCALLALAVIVAWLTPPAEPANAFVGWAAGLGVFGLLAAGLVGGEKRSRQKRPSASASLHAPQRPPPRTNDTAP